MVMYMLQLAIALCVESIILLDQLPYPKEQGIYDVSTLTQQLFLLWPTIGYNTTVMPLFDPSISPCTFVIITHKSSYWLYIETLIYSMMALIHSMIALIHGMIIVKLKYLINPLSIWINKEIIWHVIILLLASSYRGQVNKLRYN